MLLLFNQQLTSELQWLPGSEIRMKEYTSFFMHNVFPDFQSLQIVVTEAEWEGNQDGPQEYVHEDNELEKGSRRNKEYKSNAFVFYSLEKHV